MSVSAQRLRDSLIGSSLVGEGKVRFFLRTLLGEGGQGWVFKANYDEPDGFWVVVKMLRHEGVNAESLKRFERETRVLQMLGAVPIPNPNIVRFFDHGYHSIRFAAGDLALPFIALEFVDGPNLAMVLEQAGNVGLPLRESVPLMRQIARALATVHEQKIVHRDLKPSNILLAMKDGQRIAKVTDFGLVKMTGISTNSTGTLAGASLGYAPPEQYEMGNSRVTARTDIFSFATIVYEVLSGRPAFPHDPGESPLRLVARMLSGPRPSIERAQMTMPQELRVRGDLLRSIDVELVKAMASDPLERHESIVDFWSKVEPLLRDAMASRIGEEPSYVGVAPPIPLEPVGFEIKSTSRPLIQERLRHAVAWNPDGSIVAVGHAGIYSFAGTWTRTAIAEFAPRDVKGVKRLRSGEMLFFGNRGLLCVVSPEGRTRMLAEPDPSVTWFGAHTEDGDIVVCGERSLGPTSTVGVIGEFSQRATHVTGVEGSSRFVGVTRLAGGQIVACGHHGDLVCAIGGAFRAVPWGRTGHLLSIVRDFQGGGFVVGTGGHALSLTPSPAAQHQAVPPTALLESVQTTRDLHAVTLDAKGVPWAVGGAGRLLKRGENRVWARVEVRGVDATLVAIQAVGPNLVLVAEDGTVIEGHPT